MNLLNGRIYRAAFVPFAIALAIASFSLSARPGPQTSTLAPDAFDGQQAAGELRRLAAEFPQRRPGSADDAALARRVAGTIEGLGGTAGGGFSVRVQHVRAQTIDGEQTLQTVIAQRPGSTAHSPIVILAHRDAAATGGSAQAQLSGTAALLELARVFASRETHRTIVLVSSSGGSGGDGGAAEFVAHTAVGAEADAAIVLGDIASVSAAPASSSASSLDRPTGRLSAPSRPLLVVPYSDGYGSASDVLQRTLATAIARETGVRPAAPTTVAQLAHLAFPLAAGEQGVLNAAGTPSVLVQVAGEREPDARAPVSAERLEGVGKAVLSAVDALDTAPDLARAPQTGLVLAHQIVPGWALRLLVATLLLPPLAVLVDALARARRRRQPLGRWMAWACACGLPFAACALFAIVLGALAVLPAAPLTPPSGGALALGAGLASATLACALVLALAWLAWPVCVRRLGLAVRPAPQAPGSQVAGVATLLVLALLAWLVWVVDPYAALLLVPGLHLWLAIASPERRPRPPAGLGLIALALAPLGLLVAFYAHALGYGLGEVVTAPVLLLAGGHVDVIAAVLWSLAAGGVTAIAMVALTPPAAPPVPGGFEEHAEITIRGPLSYAGPGSLGGTESALRR